MQRTSWKIGGVRRGKEEKVNVVLLPYSLNE
jgi:hypothetical protein